MIHPRSIIDTTIILRLKGLGGGDVMAMLRKPGQLHEEHSEDRVKAGRRIRNIGVLPEKIMIFTIGGWFGYDKIFKDKLFRQADVGAKD